MSLLWHMHKPTLRACRYRLTGSPPFLASQFLRNTRALLSAVLTRVAPALICAAHVIEEEHVHCRGAERSKFEVMRHHELVVGTVPPLEGQSFCLLIILLLRLFLPREEEAA